MEPEQSSTGVNKPSGLPRPTRLPVSTVNSSSRLPLPKPQGVTIPPKPSNEPTRLPKQPSIPTFSQPRTSTLGHGSASSANGHFHATKSLTTKSNVQNAPPRPTSRTLPPTSVKASSKPPTNRDEEEDNDKLSSLDSFRTASRQGLYEDPAPSPLEYVEPTEVPEISKNRKPSRPSLSDRTVESIQNLPATPKDRRRSSFFSPTESPMGPPPRPTSSLSRNGSNAGSRPGTSDGSSVRVPGRPPSAAKVLPSSAKPALRSSIGISKAAPSNPTRRSLSSAFHGESQSGKAAAPPVRSLATASRQNGGPVPKPTPGSKTVAARGPKTRPSLSEAFGPAVRGDFGKHEPSKAKAIAGSSAGSQATVENSTPPKSSSAALRQQIAAAKAAARKERAKHDSPQSMSMPSDGTFQVEAYTDPFNQAPKDEKHILRNRIKSARTDGRLNIAAMGFKQIPDEVLTMYDAATVEASGVYWAEMVDLSRFIAADNEIDELPETMFPDRAAEDYYLDDDAEGSQFAGLEMLDLHGNRIQSLPIGMRHLQRLTSLNLSHNKLENSAWDVISQILTLKDLRLGHNTLSGSLPGSICQLSHLESLDVQSNRLLSLPDAMRELASLRVLNVSGNQLTVLPMDALQAIRLSDLDASNNALIASLFPVGGPSSHRNLQKLNVANNSLAAMTFDDDLDLPQLHTLDVTCNHLTGLPPMSGCPELVTLLAGENKIRELPRSFTSLSKVKNVNLAGNELSSLDPEIGCMETLDTLVLASNPLRERKFLTMNASDIKRNLMARLGPIERDVVSSTEQDDQDIGHSALLKPPSRWKLQAHNSLDLSGGRHRDDINDHLEDFLADNFVTRLNLQSNLLTNLPPALGLGKNLRILDLSDNPFGITYVSTELHMPSLEDLNISRCGIATLEPLMQHLQAPKLQAINVAANRLTGDLPILRSTYPVLLTLLAGENRLTSISVDALQGLRTVNLDSNNIEYLPPEVGLLWDEGLQNLEVGRNAFRVPNHRVLDKGTEATMRWLRSKLPSAHPSVEQ